MYEFHILCPTFVCLFLSIFAFAMCMRCRMIFICSRVLFKRVCMMARVFVYGFHACVYDFHMCVRCSCVVV